MILLTGATGELGRGLVPRLVERHGDVAVLTRDPSRHGELARSGVRLLRGDLMCPKTLADAVVGARQVLHLAALTHARRSKDYFAVNVDGTRHLLAAAEAAGSITRFVHLSTRALGDGGGGYAESKLRAEEAVRASGLPWVILRPAEVYGGGADAVTDLLERVRRRSWLPILGDGHYRLAPVYVADVIDAVVAAIDAEGIEGGCFTLSGPEELGFLELVDRLERFAGVRRRRRVHVPVLAARCAVSMAARCGVGGIVPDQVPRLLMDKAVDDGLAATALGFAPRALEAGLAAMAASVLDTETGRNA